MRRFPFLLLGIILTVSVSAQTTQTSPAAAPPDPALVRRALAEQAASKLTETQIMHSTDVDSLSRLATIYNGKDLERFAWTLERLVQLMPDSGALKYQLAAFYAGQGDKTKAYDVLLRMQMQGFANDPSEDGRFEKIHGTQVWDYLVENLKANAKPFGQGKVAFELPKGDRLLESISWDPKRKQFLFGSAREGKIYLASEDGKLVDFIAPDAQNGLMSVLDLRVDAARDLLWVATTGAPHYKRFDQSIVGKSALVKFQLSSGRLLARYASPADKHPHVFSSLALAPDGRVFVADGVRNEIYKLDSDGLKLLLANPKLKSIRGMAVSSDGKTLYFADYALGILGIDLSTSKGFELKRNPERIVLGGIDGLYWYDGTLAIVENGMIPSRVMRLKLTRDGRAVESVMPLDAAQLAFDSPTLGTVVGDSLYFIANSQKQLYDGYGVLKDPTQLAPVRIYQSDLRFAWDQPGISSSINEIPKATSAQRKQFLEEQKGARQEAPKSNGG